MTMIIVDCYLKYARFIMFNFAIIVNKAVNLRRLIPTFAYLVKTINYCCFISIVKIAIKIGSIKKFNMFIYIQNYKEKILDIHLSTLLT